MKLLPRILLISFGVLVVMGAGVYFLAGSGVLPPAIDPDLYTVEIPEYHAPAPPPSDLLADDLVDDKKPTFDPARVDSRPLGEWQVNSSGSVVKLDIEMLKPDADAKLLTLYPSYRAAVDAARINESNTQILPSINLIDGKAKQFDDGLYAAIDLAYYRGLNKALASHIDLFKRLADRLGPENPAAAFVAAGLSFAGVDVKVRDEASKSFLIKRFKDTPTRSKPIGFYTWNEPLGDCFRFLRYFQTPIAKDDGVFIISLVNGFKSDPALMADYRKVLAFYAKMTNPTRDVSIADFVDGKTEVGTNQVLAILPEATSRETELFEKLFPLGLPPDSDLMRELITAIKSGKVDLKPKADSGWYDYQVYALESFLLPQNGEGNDHLMLTKRYKERMVEAFKALLTKRKETHSRNAKTAMPAASAMPRMPENVEPRLRVEPSPAYYHRTARAYGFLANFLESSIGANELKTLHGLKEGGARTSDLMTELTFMRDLFYGFYLVCCEDIGHAPELAEGETVEKAKAQKLATDWLADITKDEDLATDTRVAVPVYIDPMARKTRLWATLGIRLSRLEATYARPPRLRPVKDSAKQEWVDVAPEKLGSKRYLIAVDEFAEVELPRLDVLNRAELRSICDAKKTKEAIIAELTGQK